VCGCILLIVLVNIENKQQTVPSIAVTTQSSSCTGNISVSDILKVLVQQVNKQSFSIVLLCISTEMFYIISPVMYELCSVLISLNTHFLLSKTMFTFEKVNFAFNAIALEVDECQKSIVNIENIVRVPIVPESSILSYN
jgi:hypothetical protein